MAIPASHLVMLHRSLRCVSKPRDFRGANRARRRPPRKYEVPLNFNGLAPSEWWLCRACGIARKRHQVAGEQGIVSGMAGRYATALFELALESNAIDAVRGDLDRFDALVAGSPELTRLVRSPV